MRLAPSVIALLALVLQGADAPSAREISALIEQLGDESGAKREVATMKLAAIGEPALEALKKAAKSHADVDVRLRAGVVAVAIEKKLWGEVRRFEAHKEGAYVVVVSPDGRLVASASGQGHTEHVVRLWEIDTGKEVKELKGHLDGVMALAFSPDGKRLLTGS